MPPQGDKSSYTSKQRRQASHIEKGAKKRGASSKRAAQIAYATVNKQDGGGKKSGSGRGKKRDTSPSKRGGKRSHSGRGGRSTRTRSKSSKSRSTRSRSTKSRSS